MGIGIGIVLLVAGLILLTGTINFDLTGVEDTTLGWILLLAGILGIVLGFMASRRAATSRTVEERRVT